MSVKHTSRSLLKSLLGVSLLMSAIFYDGSSMMSLIFNDPGLFSGVQAANKDHTTTRLLKAVVPGSERFSEKEGEVPVYKAYGTDPDSGAEILIGYAVVTADVPPEPDGYSGPIDTLIGIDLEGNIVGLKVIYYKESLRYTIGDFFSFRGYEDQFIGKTARDNFFIGKDIDGISKATISSKAMARGVRQTVRAVTEAYLK